MYVSTMLRNIYIYWFDRCGRLKIYSKSQRNKVDDSQRQWKIFKNEDKI